MGLKIDKKIQFILVVLGLVLFVGLVWHIAYALQLNRFDLVAKNLIEEEVQKTLAEIIVDQIKTGSTACPKDDLITYETCLMFQGALGVWQREGLVENCPNILDPHHFSFSEPERRDVRISRTDVLKAFETPCFSYLFAIAIANRTPILVSTANKFFHMAVAQNYIEPGTDPELCLALGYGSCGNHAAVAIRFFERAGFKARSVQFYYEQKGARLSHVTPEVWIDGDWRLIDSTYGAYWINEKPGTPFQLVSTNYILMHKLKPNYYNSALLPIGFYSAISQFDYFSYISEKADVIRGGSGEITLNLKNREGSENFLHKPNFVGDNLPDEQVGGLQFRLHGGKYKYHIRVTVSGSVISNNAEAYLCIDELCDKYLHEKSEYVFVVSNPSKLYLKTGMDVGYVVMKSFDWQVVEN